MTASMSLRRKLTPLALALALIAAEASAQTPPEVYAPQRATAQQVAERGVALEELAAGAPESYTVKPGDTLWGISGMYLKHPWRWPELWGMNLEAIRNPHLIFPGQTLTLDKDGDYARLRASQEQEPETVKLSPRTRVENLAHGALPTLKPQLIEPFLAQPLVVDPLLLQSAARIVAATDRRVLMGSGDRVYVRGDAAAPLMASAERPLARHYSVFRSAIALKDPRSGELLGYEAQYLGKAELVRPESTQELVDDKGGKSSEFVPGTVTLTATKGDVMAGDRLLPAPARAFMSYTPHAPENAVDARVVSIYGNSALDFAAQNQVVSINRGARDGIEPGHVLSLMSEGERVKDSTLEDKPTIKLPNEVNGKAMVFRVFDRVAYALILEIRNGVRVGDQLLNPQ